MTISVIIPTFKRPKLLRHAIASALNQTFSNIVVCIHDNASHDETKMIVEAYQKQDSRVHYHEHLNNIGMIENYVFSLTQIQTPYFCFLSDDDLLLPNFLEDAIKAFKQYPHIGFAAGSTLIIQGKTGKLVDSPLDRWKNEGYLEGSKVTEEMIGNFPIPTGVLFSSAVLSKVAIDKENALFWDWDFLVQISLIFPIFILKKPCALFRLHSHSFFHSRDLSEYEKGLQRLVLRTKNFARTSPHLLSLAENWTKNALTDWRRKFFFLYLMQKRFEDSFELGKCLDQEKNHSLKSRVLFQCMRRIKDFKMGLKILSKILRIIYPLEDR